MLVLRVLEWSALAAALLRGIWSWRNLRRRKADHHNRDLASLIGSAAICGFMGSVILARNKLAILVWLLSLAVFVAYLALAMRARSEDREEQ